jgi:hypothetical protein
MTVMIHDDGDDVAVCAIFVEGLCHCVDRLSLIDRSL